MATERRHIWLASVCIALLIPACYQTKQRETIDVKQEAAAQSVNISNPVLTKQFGDCSAMSVKSTATSSANQKKPKPTHTNCVQAQ